MSDKKEHPAIAQNPSARMISDALPLLRLARLVTSFAKRIGTPNENLERINRVANDVLQRSDVLTLPDRFNDAFAQEGWVAIGSMSVETMQKAVDLYEAGKKQEAEDEIIAWFQEDTINLFAINRAKTFNKAGNRWHQLREALKLTFEERYWAAVPLILIACDGFASDVLGTSPFKKNADLTAFDSVAGHPNSLLFLIKALTKGVQKSSDKELTLPLRHGILHGQSLGACAIGCFCWAPRGFADNEMSDCLLRSATRGHRPAGGRRMPVGLPANRADWGRIALLHAAASPCIRFMFNARHTRAHSPCAWFKPRTLKRRKPSACLIQPLGASDSHLRLAYCA